jgi:hypothetical protein
MITDIFSVGISIFELSNIEAKDKPPNIRKKNYE